MRNIWIIAKRELKHYFISPIAYVIFAVTLLVLGGLLFLDIYYASLGTGYVPTVQRTLELFAFPILFIAVPALTMRSVAEENRMGTLELLLTAPLNDWQLIIGKWLGSVLFFLSILAVTLVYPIVINQLVEPGIDLGLMAGGYIGIFLLMATMCAIGVCISSLFSNQIAAFFAAFGAIVLFWVIGSPAQVTSGTISEIFRYLSLTEHFYSNMMAGILRIDDILYYVSFTAFALFLGSTIVETRRWR